MLILNNRFLHLVSFCRSVHPEFLRSFLVLSYKVTNYLDKIKILEQSPFQKYATSWVFLALRRMLYMCICVFFFVSTRLTHMCTWEYRFSGTLPCAAFVYFVFCLAGGRTGEQRCYKRSSRT